MKNLLLPKRINQCMSCYFFKHTVLVECKHENYNDPNEDKFCYDYIDLEGGIDDK
ncbi:MAG: hypothetical protein GY714_32390 [Desulfobacterales bacterium]|nr:hypothetical protein [Desulfobacterales bacterium]